MMRVLKVLAGVAIVASLVACGGGGGSDKDTVLLTSDDGKILVYNHERFSTASDHPLYIFNEKLSGNYDSYTTSVTYDSSNQEILVKLPKSRITLTMENDIDNVLLLTNVDKVLIDVNDLGSFYTSTNREYTNPNTGEIITGDFYKVIHATSLEANQLINGFVFEYGFNYVSDHAWGGCIGSIGICNLIIDADAIFIKLVNTINGREY